MAVNPLVVKKCAHDFCGSVCEAEFGTRRFDVTCLAAPLQIEGHVDGVPYYFRERHDRWRLESGDKQIDEGKTPDVWVALGPDCPPGIDVMLAWAMCLIVNRMDAWIWPPDPAVR